MGALWDPKMAAAAAAIDQATRMGGVIIAPKPKPPTGFSAPEPPKP